jgi:acetylornithine deacetylase/succinyl-diaminopimelate desuccinylase-like protein
MHDFLSGTIGDLVAIPSPSGEEARVADYICERLRASGLTPQRDEHDNVWVEINRGGAKTLHVNAHMDTVVPADGWKTDPFIPVVEGDRLHGLGASDCKAGVAALLWLAPRVRPQVRVICSFTVCEEGVGHAKPNGSRRIAAMGGHWAITAESSCAPDGPGVSLGTQGHARARVTFAGRAAHSARPELGENAVLAASRFCIGLERLNAGFADRVVYPGVTTRPTVAPTIIRGGRLDNVIPEACEVTVSRRLAPGENAETFRAELDRLLEGSRASYELSCDGPCATVDTGGFLFAAARDAILEVCGRERFLFQRGRTDAVIFAGHGMDTLTIGPGQVGQAHTANEHVDLKAAAECVRVMESVISRLR